MRPPPPSLPLPALGALAPIGLQQLQALGASLQRRRERKFLLGRDQADVLVRLLGERGYRVLEVDGRRSGRYASRYFDSPDLACLRMHGVHGQPRLKVRIRDYLDSGFQTLELKLKDAAGQTDKRRRLRARHGVGTAAALSAGERRFLADELAEAFALRLPDGLQPTLTVSYERVTLVSGDGAERITFDFGVRFDSARGAAALPSGLVIVESKAAAELHPVEPLLAGLGLLPVQQCSKYCLGTALTGVGAANPGTLALLAALGLQAGDRR